MTVSESQTHHARNDAADSSPTKSLFLTARESMPVSILALTMFLLPAVGVPNEMMLQDTLKSAIVAHGVLIAALVFFWEQRKRREPLLWHGMVWLPVILMFYAMGSMVWSHTYLAGVEAIRWFTVALLMWLGLNTLTRENIPILFWGIHFGVVVASVWAALQFWLGWSLFPQAAQPASTFANRNFLAEYMVCSLPFSVYLLARMRNTSWLAPMAFSLALNIVALVMTGTRSALVALLVSIPALGLVIVRCRERWSFRRWNARNHALVGFTLVFAVSGLGSIPCGNANIIFEQRGDTAIARSFTRVASMTEREEYTQRSFSIRNQMWMATARMMLDYPWTGVGAGSWEVRIPLYQRTHTVLETDYYTHNEYLQLLSEYGLVVGGLSIAFLFAYFLHAAGATYRLQLAGLVEHPVRVATLASLFSLLIVSVAGFPWHLASCCALLALGLSILAASDVRLKMQSPKTFRSIPWRPSFAYGCVAASMCLLLLGGGITYQAAQAELKILHALKLAALISKTSPPFSGASATAYLELLQDIREGVALNPHYRKLTAVVAEPLSAAGDWKNVVWILETVANSRPHVAAIWAGLAKGYSELGDHSNALRALGEVRRLKPDAALTRELEVNLLSNADRDAEATNKLMRYFDEDTYSYELAQLGYAIGYKTKNWPLAIRSLQLRNKTWPESAADGHFRLGRIYGEALRNHPQALTEFRSGWAAVPSEQKQSYRNQVPVPFRDLL